ncbi:MAG: tryptophan synthase subunit alpha [Armatimonadetes bacterium]|nr:tryptophan synthase subunit alpha [Armatimonadota bacterium]
MQTGLEILGATFAQLRAKSEGALIPFITAGDPSLEDLPAILTALTEGGADLIEVGIPFSDPIADGPTIQASSQRALDRGVTPRAILELLATNDQANWAPIVIMGYYNPLLRFGLPAFAQAATKCGTVATIISDLTPESAQPWLSASAESGLGNVFLIAPTSSPERITKAIASASGFVYAISRTGVTGAGKSEVNDVTAMISQIRDATELPVVVGFGISTPEQVRTVCQVADGAVVGSTLVQMLADNWESGKGRPGVIEYIRSLKAATR